MELLSWVTHAHTRTYLNTYMITHMNEQFDMFISRLSYLEPLCIDIGIMWNEWSFTICMHLMSTNSVKVWPMEQALRQAKVLTVKARRIVLKSSRLIKKKSLT